MSSNPIFILWSLLFLGVCGYGAPSNEKKIFVEAGAVISDIYTPKKPDGKYNSDATAQIGLQGRIAVGSVVSVDPFLSYPLSSGKDGGSNSRSYLYIGIPVGFKIVNGSDLDGQIHLGPAALLYQMKSNVGDQTSRAWALDLGADVSYDRWKISFHTLWQQIASKSRNANALLTVGAGF